MSVKINASILGIRKHIEIKETTKNVQRALMIQKDIVKAELSAKEMEEHENELTAEDIQIQLDASLDLITSINDFVIHALKLNDDQIEKLEEDTERDDVMDLAITIISELLHIEATEDNEVADKSLKG